MPVPGDKESDPAIAGPLGGLLLAAVRPAGAMVLLRAVRWWRDLDRLGVRLPLFVVHDVGILYGAPVEQFELAPRPGADALAARMAGLPDLLETYRSIVAEIAESDAAKRARAMKLSDDLVVVLLARILGSLTNRGDIGRAPSAPAALPLDPELFRDLDAQLSRLFSAVRRTDEVDTLGALARGRLFVLTLADALDLETLRLLKILGSEATAAGALAHVDLLAALSSPMTSEIVDFSLELLPRVLETSHAKAVGTHAVHGYAGVGRKGSIDSLVLTELAWDREELGRRMADGELLFYTRERAPREARRLHHIVIDASASMRGEREVFARGLAIALGKKLLLAGEEVWMRFFDSRLYEVQRATDRSQLPAAWLLGFKGERGRNPARVFAQLATETALLRKRDQRDPVIHLITHAALHVPRPLVEEVRRQAHLFGVFILPSGGALDLEWLDLLEGHAVIDHATLLQQSARASAATKIVNQATRV
ncbi:MAG TPA: hypothetical protein VGM06_03575 [Polyangiaceae bacterium]|jgi:hypothetical protein